MIRWIILFLFVWGCSSVTPEEPRPGFSGEYAVSVRITPPETRSFSGTTSEKWEKKVNKGIIYVFNPAGNLVFTYTLKTADTAAINQNLSAVIGFLLPGNLTSCDFYFVANTTPSAPVTTRTSLHASLEKDIGLYNGTYSQVLAQGLRSGGFVMTASQSNVTINTSGTTSVPLTLRRIVSKVAIEISFSSLLTLGTLKMDSLRVTQSAPWSNLFPLASASTGGTAVTLRQVPQLVAGSSPPKYRSFFYIYENDTRTAPAAVTVSFWGSNTVLMLLPVPFGYSFTLSGENGTGTYGKIARNRVYYVSATVNKLINLLAFDDVPDLEVHERWE